MQHKILALLVIGVTVCGCGPRTGVEEAETPSAPPNTDTQRFGLLEYGGNNLVRLGASKRDVLEAFPVPPEAKVLPKAGLPEGYDMVAWSELNKKGVAKTFIAYFDKGGLIEASYSVAPLNSDEASRWVDQYIKAFGQPETERAPGQTFRYFGLPQDACRLKLETLRVGDDYRVTATLIDTEAVTRMQQALKAMRAKPK